MDDKEKEEEEDKEKTEEKLTDQNEILKAAQVDAANVKENEEVGKDGERQEGGVERRKKGEGKEEDTEGDRLPELGNVAREEEREDREERKEKEQFPEEEAVPELERGIGKEEIEGVEEGEAEGAAVLEWEDAAREEEVSEREEEEDKDQTPEEDTVPDLEGGIMEEQFVEGIDLGEALWTLEDENEEVHFGDHDHDHFGDHDYIDDHDHFGDPNTDQFPALIMDHLPTTQIGSAWNTTVIKHCSPN